MDEMPKRLTVAILAVPESTASTLFGMYDVLASAGRDWDLIMTGVPGPAPIAPAILTADGRPFRAANGTLIHPDGALGDSAPPDVVCIPDLAVAPGEDIGGRYDAQLRWLRERFDAGATIATSCTGALMPAEAGLLDGLEATTHWAFCDAMAARYPKISVHPARALITTGEAQRLVMAGGGTSWLDLALYIVARYLGIEEAMRTARLHLIDWHDVGQQPFAMLTRTRQDSDAVIARCQEWAAEHYDEDRPVAAMAELSGLAERSFKRRFRAATGMSPMEYVHSLRLEEAKQMLETTDLPVEAVVNEVGYEDSSFFGRLFRRRVGMTPAQYRRRFGALRKALSAGGTDRREPDRRRRTETAPPAPPA